MQIEQLVQQIAVQLHLPDLHLDDEGLCAIRFDQIPVAFQADEGGQGLMLSSPLGQVMPDDPATLEELMRGNFFSDGVGGSTLAMTPDGAVFLREHHREQDLSFPGFMQALERFVNLAEHWQGRLS